MCEVHVCGCDSGDASASLVGHTHSQYFLRQRDFLQRQPVLCFFAFEILAWNAAGFLSTCENAVWCCRRGGRMVQVGLPLELRPAIPMARVAGWELELIGSHGMAAADFPAILDMVARGELDPEALVEREVTLEQGAEAIMAMDRGSNLGMTMVTSF